MSTDELELEVIESPDGDWRKRGTVGAEVPIAVASVRNPHPERDRIERSSELIVAQPWEVDTYFESERARRENIDAVRGGLPFRRPGN